MFGHEYRCDRCGQTGSYTTSIGYYCLDDGTVIVRADQAAWCYDCRELRSAERLPNERRIADIISDIQANGLSDDDKEYAAFLSQNEDTYLAEMVFKWKACLKWRRARKSPPRCLECESTSLLLLNPDVEQALDSFAHPQCGGTFQSAGWWHSSQAAYQVLDPEGRHLTG
jgi:hypothetical protein